MAGVVLLLTRSNSIHVKPPEFKDDLESGIDYYELLRVDEWAKEEEILSSFRVRIREVHPDLGGDHEAAARLLRARRTLTGPDRAAYDAARSAKAREAHERFLRAEDARRNAGYRTARPPSPPPHPRPAPRRSVPGMASDLTSEQWEEADRFTEEWARAVRDGIDRDGRRRQAAGRPPWGPTPPSSSPSWTSPPPAAARPPLATEPPGFPRWDGGEARRRHLEKMAAMEQEFEETKERLGRERRVHAADFERMKREYEEMKARADRRRASRSQSPRRETAGSADDFLAKTRAATDEVVRKTRADTDELVRRTRAATDEILRKSRIPRR